MMGAKTIGCINHPGVEAIGRCRQCSKPVCRECGVTAASGVFCSDACREKHEQFMQRARALDLNVGNRRGLLFRLRKLLGGFITLGALLFAIGFVATIFEIPVLYDLVLSVREALGF